MTADSSQTAAIHEFAANVLRMYLTRDRSLIEKLYTSDDEAPPIIFDIGNSFIDGSPWVRSRAMWSKSLHHYFDLLEGETDTPRVKAMRYVDPQVVVDGDLASFVALLILDLEAQGSVREQLMRYTLVLRRFGGKWKIWNEHFSAALTQEIILGSAGSGH